MTKNKAGDVIHISEIDEYLASRLMEEGLNEISLKVGKSGSDGFISVSALETEPESGQAPLDFELSPSEYHSLNDIELEELLRAPLVTSSALELFDFLLLRLSGFNCTISFTESAWKIKVSEPLHIK